MGQAQQYPVTNPSSDPFRVTLPLEFGSEPATESPPLSLLDECKASLRSHREGSGVWEGLWNKLQFNAISLRIYRRHKRVVDVISSNKDQYNSGGIETRSQ